MFGEYIPFTKYLPDDFFLKTLCPEAHHGIKPVAFPIMKTGSEAERNDRIGQGSEGKRVEASVNICFESTVAHLIRRQILTLRREGHDPRLLINMSNDGWFRNSNQMEQHLATHVFRAVENRMWYVTATNGGYSAIIDPYGSIQKKGERGAAEAVSDTIYLKLDEPHSLTIYQKYGDGYALPLALGVLFLAGLPLLRTIRANASEPQPEGCESESAT
jgi:apolipoprotein N-acyltransferase